MGPALKNSTPFPKFKKPSLADSDVPSLRTRRAHASIIPQGSALLCAPLSCHHALSLVHYTLAAAAASCTCGSSKHPPPPTLCLSPENRNEHPKVKQRGCRTCSSKPKAASCAMGR